MRMLTALRQFAGPLLFSPVLVVLSVVSLQTLPTSPQQDQDVYLPLISQQEPQPTPTPTLIPTAPPGADVTPTPTQTPIGSPVPTTTSTPDLVEGVVAPMKGIWLTADELRQLPTTGDDWEQLREVADEAATADLGDQDSRANVIFLAKALVYARTGETQYRDQVVAALRVITFNHTEDNGRTLALGRELGAYVIAADQINLPVVYADLHAQFSQKLRELLTKKIASWGSSTKRSLQQTHELRPNNWGTHAGASRAAVAAYLGDTAELDRTALVFRGYLGDRSAYNSFEFSEDLSWHIDPANPLGVNPLGSVKDGFSIDGALTEEMQRGGPFQLPPLHTDYAWEALQGVLVQAQILHRQGYDAWEWENRAILRAVQFIYNLGWTPKSSELWMVFLVNRAYQTSFPTDGAVHPGKNMGWTNWTHR